MTNTEPYAGRTVLVTGGSGFIGTNLTIALARSSAEIRVFGRSWPSVHGPVVTDQLRFFKGDIRDEAAVEQAVTGCDVIFHLAGKSGPAASSSSPMEDLDVNCRGQLILLEACRRLTPSARIVFPSSRLVYAPGLELPVPESAPLEPTSIYGSHKLAAESYYRVYSRLYGLKTVILRLTNPYGPFQRPEQNRYGIINWFIHRALADHPLTVYGEGRQLRDYVYIDDVVQAMLLAGSKPDVDGLTLNVGGGSPTAFVDMANTIVQLSGKGRVEHAPWPDLEARVETGDFVADTSLTERTLGWRASTSLVAGIREVVRRYPELSKS